MSRLEMLALAVLVFQAFFFALVERRLRRGAHAEFRALIESIGSEGHLKRLRFDNLDRALERLLQRPHRARLLVLAEDEDGGRWCWGQTVDVAPGARVTQQIAPQRGLKAGALAFCFGDGVRLVGLYAGQRALTAMPGEGLFGSNPQPMRVGNMFTFELEGDKR